MADRSAALPLGVTPAVPGAPAAPADRLRRDLRLIAEMVEPESRVLDIGCGDGALLAYLAREKGVDARGTKIERSITLDRHGRPFSLDPRGGLANLLAEQGVFVLSGKSRD